MDIEKSQDGFIQLNISKEEMDKRLKNFIGEDDMPGHTPKEKRKKNKRKDKNKNKSKSRGGKK